MDTLIVLRDSVIAYAGKAANCSQYCEESIISSLAWPTVVVIGLILAFTFAMCWLYKSKRPINQDNNSENQVTDSKEKQLGKLQDLLYKHLLTRVYLEKVDEGGNKYKEYNEDNDNLYIETLKKAIDELKGKLSHGSKETKVDATQV